MREQLEAQFLAKKHIIWDWNGTLLSDLDHAVRVVNVLLTEAQLPNTSVDIYREEFGFPVAKYYETLGFDMRPENFLALCQRFNEHFHSGLKNCDLWPGAREVLAHNRASGRVQSLLSASEHQILHESIKHFNLVEMFDHVLGVFDKTAHSKVDRGHELMQLAKVAKADTVMVGDTLHDLEVGQALGIDVILVDHGHQSAKRLRQAHANVVTLFSPR